MDKPLTTTPDIPRPPKAWLEALKHVGAATAASTLAHHAGIRSPYMVGPIARNPGQVVCGPALTLQCMPKREDLFSEEEYKDPETQLHRHVLYHTQPGDVVVVDARGDMRSGIFGDMMLTYFRGKGGVGVVIDGCIRDYPKVKHLELGLWLRGVTPNYHAQTDIVPYAVNVPVACGGVFVEPGDIILADDDGVVVIPVGMAERVIDEATKHHDWEEFSREQLMRGGELQRYYPLHADAEPEYQEWQRKNAKAP